MKKRTHTERGQALILIVLGVVALIGLTGLAVDGSLAYTDRRQAQNAADAAALSGALAYIRGQDAQAAALQAATQNGYANDAESTVAVHQPPVDGPYAGNVQYIQVVITSKVQARFGTVVGLEEINNTVQAVARAKPVTQDNMVFGNAVVALKEHGRGAMRSHGNNNLEVYGGGLFVNSDDDCAFDQMGNSTIFAPNGGLNSVGGVCLRGSIDPASHIDTGVSAVPYPPISLPPTPLCTAEATVNGNTMTPGYYTSNQSFPPRGVDTLNPGIYCVDATFMMNAHDRLVGHDVVIYMVDGNIHWNGLAEIELTAPTTGPFAGLLIYMPMTNDEGIILNGNMNSSLVGTILAPASDIQLNGTMNSSMYHTQVIGLTVDLIGDADIVVTYNDAEQYEAPIPPAVELVQ
jgi:Flp pilus assembly protein TadG